MEEEMSILNLLDYSLSNACNLSLIRMLGAILSYEAGTTVLHGGGKGPANGMLDKIESPKTT
jgi:hypothetical protein